MAPRHETQVLILGGGVAGLSIALKLANADRKVTVLAKRTLTEGSSRYAQGGIAALRDLQMPDDTEGFTLTLESSDIGDQPQGRIIMIGDSPVKL